MEYFKNNRTHHVDANGGGCGRSWSLTAGGLSAEVERVQGVVGIGVVGQVGSKLQLCLSAIHDGEHPVPGGLQTLFNKVLEKM